MSIFRSKLHWPAWLALLLTVALLAACQPPAPPLPPRSTDTPQPAAFECSELKTSAVSDDAVATAHYILNQVIVTGPVEAVQAVIDQLGGLAAGFIPLQTCIMADRLAEQPETERWSEASDSRGDAPAIQFPADATAPLSTGLYAIPPGQSTEEIVNQINEIGREDSGVRRSQLSDWAVGRQPGQSLYRRAARCGGRALRGGGQPLRGGRQSLRGGRQLQRRAGRRG
ncbi:MAG: hypothetical protein V9H69_25700 [Anaerolineae bacterium]